MVLRFGTPELRVRYLQRLAMAGGAALACASAPAWAAQLPGFVDGVGAGGIDGWSCVSPAGVPGEVAVYAGGHRTGVFPSIGDRPDTASACRAQGALTGFDVAITPLLAQQFFGQTSLSVYALGGAGKATLLPASNAAAADPYFLPSGLLTGLSASGNLSGLVSKPIANLAAPTVAIYAGGPANAGGMLLGNATVAPSGKLANAFSFASLQLHDLLANAPAGLLTPVYAYGSFGSGPAVQLGNAAVSEAAYAPLAAQVVQSGAVSGVTTTLLTQFVPGNWRWEGLSGSITFAGNFDGFSEALITVGTTSDDQAACQAKNRTTPLLPPPFTRLAAFIMKGTDTSPDTVPVDIALPYAMPLAGSSGTCLLTWVSAGYPNLTPQNAKYTTVTANLAAALTPAVTGAPVSFAEGVGNEFRFSPGPAVPLYTVVAMRMLVTVALDAIAGSVSVAGVVDGLPSSGWLPVPSGSWVANTDFYVFPSVECAGLGLDYGTPTSYYAVGLNKTPVALQVPAAARLLVHAPLSGAGALESQASFLQTFQNPAAPGRSLVTLGPGDCLVALHSVTGLDGNLDFENQSTAYFHLPG